MNPSDTKSDGEKIVCGDCENYPHGETIGIDTKRCGQGWIAKKNWDATDCRQFRRPKENEES